MSAETFFSIFKTESMKQAEKLKEEEQERENAKASLHADFADNGLRQLTTQQIQDISRRFQEANQTDVPESHIRYALNSEYAQGDADKAFEL